MTIRNIGDKAGGTRDTLQRLVSMRRALLNSTAEPAGYSYGGAEVMRKVVDTGALPDSTSKNVAHGIAAMAAVVKLGGVAWDLDGSSEVQAAKSMPDADVALGMDATNITLTTSADQTGFDSSLVWIEYTLA